MLAGDRGEAIREVVDRRLSRRVSGGKSGERTAVAALDAERIQRLEAKARAMLVALGLPTEHLQDHLQDALLLLIRKGVEVFEIESWVCGVIRRKALRSVSRSRRFVDLESLDREYSVESRTGELRVALKEALGRLTVRERAAVSLRWLAGQSVPEVAAEIGVFPANAKKILHRSLRKLRNLRPASPTADR